MKLYYAEASPYVRKVRIFLDLGDLGGQVEVVPGGGTPVQPNEATVSANPLGKVPCLITDEGMTLFDSRVITRWLDSKAGTGLYPAPPTLWPVLALEALADGILDAAVLCVYEGRVRPEELRFAPWVDAQQQKIIRATGALERHVDGPLTGPMTAAHVAVGVALGYLDFRLPQLDWRGASPRLADWYAEFARQPFMQATMPSG